MTNGRARTPGAGVTVGCPPRPSRSCNCANCYMANASKALVILVSVVFLVTRRRPSTASTLREAVAVSGPGDLIIPHRNFSSFLVVGDAFRDSRRRELCRPPKDIQTSHNRTRCQETAEHKYLNVTKCDCVALQACGASEGAVQAGAVLPPDVGGRVEGTGGAAKPGLDALHDPQTR